jgi:hypothetical protein
VSAAELSRLGWDSPGSKIIPNAIGGIELSFEETISQKNEQVIYTRRGGNRVIIFHSLSGIPRFLAVETAAKEIKSSGLQKESIETDFFSFEQELYPGESDWFASFVPLFTARTSF